MGKLTKTELVNNIAGPRAFTKQAVEGVLDALCEEITDALSRGESVSLPGLGTFKPTHREARMGRLPRTGEQTEFKASNGVKFTAAKGLKEALN